MFHDQRFKRPNHLEHHSRLHLLLRHVHEEAQYPVSPAHRVHHLRHNKDLKVCTDSKLIQYRDSTTLQQLLCRRCQPSTKLTRDLVNLLQSSTLSYQSHRTSQLFRLDLLARRSVHIDQNPFQNREYRIPQLMYRVSHLRPHSLQLTRKMNLNFISLL